ncbi:unnamed protein product [Rangifer tarandus platyrhynchus]|uniref:Uncharacterized protein n=1 Tax=Rangifer tarandus platyrhynchus TaxID=3082113 RepID=A0AC59Z2L2_RANTA
MQVCDDACPTHLPQPVASGKESSDFTGATNAMLPAGGFLDCFTAGPSPRDPTSVSVASGLGRAIQFWRDKQDSQRVDGHPHRSSFSPVVGRKPSGCPALQWGKQMHSLGSCYLLNYLRLPVRRKQDKLLSQAVIISPSGIFCLDQPTPGATLE